MSPRKPGTDCVNYFPTGRQYAQRGERTSDNNGIFIHKYLELTVTTTNHLNVGL